MAQQFAEAGANRMPNRFAKRNEVVQAFTIENFPCADETVE